MGTFSKDQDIMCDPSVVPSLASHLETYFKEQGYETFSESVVNGGYDISISKGGVFKAVLGMKTALKISLKPIPDGVHFKADVGIFGQQVIPLVIGIFFFWPVLVTQIWGLVQQSKLDDEALATVMEALGDAGMQEEGPRSSSFYSASTLPPSSPSQEFSPYGGSYGSSATPPPPPPPPTIDPEPEVEPAQKPPITTPYSGASATGAIFCARCGARIPSGSYFCPSCGKPVR